MKLWIGREKEGKCIGKKTLFIGDKTITYKDIENIIIDDIGIEQLYFGAGGCTEINLNVLNQCIKKLQYLYITLEISIDKLKILKDINYEKNICIIVNIKNDNFKLLNHKIDMQIKLESNDSKYISLSPLLTFQKVDTKELLDKIYKGDIILK